MNWLKHFRGNIKRSEPLKKHTTFKIGGKALYWCEPKDKEDLMFLLKAANTQGLKVSLIGSGSNLLIEDHPIKKVVVRLSSPFFKTMAVNGTCIEAGAGASLQSLVKFALERGFSGVEFLTGIPGTVGGALVMNAGISRKAPSGKTLWRSIGDVVKEMTIMDYCGTIKKLKKNQACFRYRGSSLSEYIVLSASLALKKRAKEAIAASIEEYRSYRRMNQDVTGASAGCIFKNPPGGSAGRLIDAAGLKGKRIQGAYVSTRHANFIINKGNAKAKDVLRLMGVIRGQVKKKYNILLEPEVKIWR